MNKMMAMTVSAGRRDGGGVADHAGEGVAHHAPAGGRQHQEEGAEQLGEQPPPLLPRVVEVGDAVDDALLVAGERTERARRRCLLVSRSRLPHIGVGKRARIVRPPKAAVLGPTCRFGGDPSQPARSGAPSRALGNRGASPRGRSEYAMQPHRSLVRRHCVSPSCPPRHHGDKSNSPQGDLASPRLGGCPLGERNSAARGIGAAVMRGGSDSVTQHCATAPSSTTARTRRCTLRSTLGLRRGRNPR